MFTMLPMTALAGADIVETYDELVRKLAEGIGDRDNVAYTIHPAEDFGWPEYATLTIPSKRDVFASEAPLEIPSGITIVVEDHASFGGEELLVNGTIELENGSIFAGNQLLVNGTVNFPYQDIPLSSFQKVTVGPTANFVSSNSSIGSLPDASIPVGSTWEIQEGATLNADIFLAGTLTGEGTVTGQVNSYGAYNSQAVDGSLSGNLTLTGGLRVGYEHSDVSYDDKLTIQSGSHITLKNANLQLAKATINLGGTLEFVSDDAGYGNAQIAQGGKILMDGGQLIVNYPCTFYQSAVSYDMDLTEETRDQFPRLIEGNGTIICNTKTVEEALSHTLLSHRVTDILEWAKVPDKLTWINCFIDFKTITVQADAPQTYTVNFDPMGGQVSTTQATTDANGQLPSLPVPTRDGYVFDGWYTQSTGGETVTATYQFSVDTTIYAQWTLAPTFTVTFEPNGGNVSPIQMTTDTDGTLTTLPTPTRDGYVFNGWYTQPTGGETVTSAYQFSVDTTIYARWSVIQSSTTPDYDYGGGSYDPPVSSGSNNTTTQKNPDGSTTTTKTDKDGTVTETTKHTDGSTSTVETAKDGTVTTTEKDAKGNKTETVENTDGTKEFTAKQKDGSEATASVDRNGTVKAEVELSQKALNNAAANDEAVTLPIPAISVDKFSAASTITVDLPDNAGKTSVVVPMEEMTPGSVVVIVLPDGTEKVVTSTKAVEEGLAVELDGDCTFKVVDNSKDFADVKPGDWFSDATDFVSSRELFAGTSETEFSPNAEMTMEMLFAVAHNFMGKPERTGTNNIAGAKPEDWFHTASNWAAEAGLTTGLKMDMLGRNLPISREDTAILLYNLAGVDYTPSEEALAKLNSFSDIADMDPDNLTALAWAVENGIMNGMGDGTFGFKGNNTRAQTGAIMMNFNNNL